MFYLLSHSKIFHDLHFRESDNTVLLHCYDVWFEGQAPWNIDGALSSDSPCIFSVIQSTSGVRASTLLSQTKDMEYVHRSVL